MEEDDDDVSKAFKNWEKLRRSLSLESSQILSKNCSMVVIRDSLPNDRSVFPPVNHEGLFYSSKHNQFHDNSSSSPSSSSSLSPPFSPSSPSASSSPTDVNGSGDDIEPPSPQCSSGIQFARGVSWWLSFGLELLRSKVIGSASSLRFYAVPRGAFLSFFSAAGAVTSVLLWWWLVVRVRQRRRRRRVLEKGVDHLISVIKERDEKIVQLLHQIIQMNEVLLACHKNMCGGPTRSSGLT